VNNVIEREQFYLDTFNPEYNILKVAGSLLGFKHSEDSRNLMSLAAIRRFSSEEERNTKRIARLGFKLPESTIKNMVVNNRLRQPVLIKNIERGDCKEFASIAEAGLYLGVARGVIKRRIENNIPLKGYLVTKVDAGISLPSPKTPSGKGQHVFIKNLETGDSKEFSSLKAVYEYLGISAIRL
jgi:group I intron endonuclease